MEPFVPIHRRIGEAVSVTEPPVPESFADHPSTIGELRSDRSGSAHDWTPRDALVAALREIDSGRWCPDVLIVGCGDKQQGGSRSVKSFVSSPDSMITKGLAASLLDRVTTGD